MTDETSKVLKQIRNLAGCAAFSLLAMAAISAVELAMNLNLLRPYKSYLQQSLPTGAEQFRRAAKEYSASGDFPRALQFFQENEKGMSNNPDFYFYRGKLYLGMQDYDKALADFQKAELLMPGWKKEWTGPLIRQALEGLGRNK